MTDGLLFFGEDAFQHILRLLDLKYNLFNTKNILFKFHYFKNKNDFLFSCFVYWGGGAPIRIKSYSYTHNNAIVKKTNGK
jgi:hypothetical protein